MTTPKAGGAEAMGDSARGIAGKLTARDMATLRRALNCAMENRAGFAEANHPGSVKNEALREVRSFERLHKKIFGDKSHRQKQIERFEAMPLVALTDWVARHKEPTP